MTRTHFEIWLALPLLVFCASCDLWGSAGAGQESVPLANQGHVCAQRSSASPAVRTWFVWSYYGVNDVESDVPGLGERFSSKGWLGIVLEDAGSYGLLVEAQPNGELRACQDYSGGGLLAGATVTSDHLLEFVRSKGANVEQPDRWNAETTEFLNSSWQMISANDPAVDDPDGLWIVVTKKAYPVRVRLDQRVIHDDWRSFPPVEEI